MSQEPDATPQPPDVAIIPEPSQRSWLTEGILIALIPASGYLWALYYEGGFCSYFYIPGEWISLGLTVVLTSSTGAFGILTIVVTGLLVVRLLLESLAIGYLGGLLFLSGIISMVLVIRDPVVGDLTGIIVIAFFLVVGIFLAFVPPLPRQQGQGNYLSRLWAHVNPAAPVRSLEASSPFYRLISRRRTVFQIFALLILVWSFAFLSFLWGRQYAQRREVFQIIAAESPRPEVAVVRVYGDYLLTVPFDRTTKEFEKKLYLLKISEMAEVPLVLENIGPLRPKP